jgi:hypothetical protein
MAKPTVKVGTYTGTGAAINLELGFVPSYFRTINITDGDAGISWFEGMAAGTGITEGAALATLGSNGITAYPGTRGDKKAGLTVGTAGSVNLKVYRYVAMRG